MKSHDNERVLNPADVRLLRGGREYPVLTAEGRHGGVVFGAYRGRTVIIYRQNSRALYYAVVRGGGSFWVQALLKLSPSERFRHIAEVFRPSGNHEWVKVKR